MRLGRRYMSQLLCGLAGLLWATNGAVAQDETDHDGVERGLTITSMGMPSKIRYFALGEVGLRPIEDRQFVGTFALGFDRSIKNPLVQLISVSGEYFMSIAGEGRGEVGMRAALESPLLRFGGGVQYEFREDRARGFITFRHPLRRGGIFWPGGQFRLMWLPGREQSLRAGVTVPIGQPFAGRARPRDPRASAPLAVADEPPTFEMPEGDAGEAIDRLARAASHLHRLSVPYIDHDARRRKNAVKDFGRAMTALDELLTAVRAGAEESRESAPMIAVREYHEAVEDAFRRAGPSEFSPESLAKLARDALLSELIFPYNRMLGQKKHKDVFDELAARARVEFARQVALRGSGPADDEENAERIFAQLIEIVRDVVNTAHDDYDDSRMIWIPPQLALLPEDHDEQDEIDDLLARAVDQRFTEGNQVWYVVAEQFHYELVRMINAARLYHVLWLHDFRGRTSAGAPDPVSYRIVLEGYLNALAERLERYDEEGVLPVYMLFLDQWYFEIQDERFWLRLLEDPLRYDMDLPDEFDNWEADIKNVQQRLRRAVAESTLLQAEIREYGEDWLYNRVRVQVNITNPADNTFWVWEGVPWIGMPDDLIRDHRKITFYDVNPLEPWRGMAVYTGMGVGEDYTGPTWDDRAIRVNGPALLSLRRQARQLLLQQGFDPEDIPFPLRDDAGDPWGRSPTPVAGADNLRASPERTVPLSGDPTGSVEAGRVMEVHNHIGYGPKLATVEKATLYSLLPPGAVIKTPDSLWNLPLWGSLLIGHALQGGRVAIIAPTLRTAPAKSPVSLSRSQELLERIIIVADMMRKHLDEAGGLLHVGLYDPEVAVGDIPGRVRQFVRTHREVPWLAELHGLDPSVLQRLEAMADSMLATGVQAEYLSDPSLEDPKLHMKAHYVASREGWDALVAQPEFGDFLIEYMKQRAIQVTERGQDRDLTELTDALQGPLRRLRSAYERAQPERSRALWYLTVGSHNQNYRSMAIDGEVLVVVSGVESQVGLADFVILTGLTSWIDSPSELEKHLPAAGGFSRKLSRWLQINS